MINWNPISTPPNPGQEVWTMDEDQGILLTTFKGNDLYTHQSGFNVIGPEWWTEKESINLPG